MPVSLNPAEMEWTVELKNDEAYSVEVKANGYLAYKNILQLDKKITIKLKPIPKQEVSISTVDFLTKKQIIGSYKLSSGAENYSGNITNGATKVNMNLLQDKNYDLEVTSNGYKTYKEIVKVNRDSKTDFVIELKKDFYEFTIRAIDAKTQKPIGKVLAKVLNEKDNQAVASKLDPVSNDLTTNLLMDNTYKIEFEANNYEKNTITINVNNEAKNSTFKKEILLTPKEQPVKKEEPKNVEVKITTPKEEPKKETPKEEPKKEIPKPTPSAPRKEEKHIIDDAIVIEETELTVKVEVYENLVVGKRYRLGSVNFEQSTPNLKPKSNIQLEKLVRTLKLNPKLKIEITGHTDNVGDPRANQFLSEQRATKIGNYLFNGGISDARIITLGKGQEEPIAPNDTEENRAKNRRVEFILRDK